MSVILNFHDVNDAFHWQIRAIETQMKVDILLLVNKDLVTDTKETGLLNPDVCPVVKYAEDLSRKLL